MTPTTFKNQWSTEIAQLQAIPLSNLKGYGLKQSTIDFLSLSGLPTDAAPFLSFSDYGSFSNDDDRTYTGLQKMTDQYDLDTDFNKYIVIGSDGEGNPLAIDTSQEDKIVWLDHDNDFEARYMNRSILDLAMTLLIYHNFINEIIALNGEGALFDANFDDLQFETLQNNIKTLDNQIFLEDSFWKDELEQLLINRAYYRANA